jgi:GDPmannose 4,6-dehydratase
MKRALITGVNGMDGSHLADLLLDKGYEVYGVERRSSSKNRINTAHLEEAENFQFITADLTDQNSLYRALKSSEPDEVYNLAAQSFVGASWSIPQQTSDVNGIGVLRILEAIREYQDDTGNKIKFYQASTSEMFGKMVENPANEETPFYPRSPYGVAKLYAHWMVKNYRESYDMFACSGILFNHESERRGIEFVTRKISDGIAQISKGLEDIIMLGNLESKRDWGYAPDYVEGMWLMLQQDEPDDYVLATGESYSIGDFLEIAFDEIGIEDWKPFVGQDPRFFRPAEVDVLRGDATKAKEKLGWTPKTSFEDLVRKMVRNDLEKYDV